MDINKHSGAPWLALPLLAALVSGSVFAQSTGVQVYGAVDTYVGSLKRSDQPASTAVVNGGGLTTSFWGVRGSEDLGGGFKTNFVLESFLQPDTGAQGRNPTDPLFSKKATVGVSGGFGEVSIGRQANLLYLSTGMYNPFGLSLQFSPVMLQSWIPAYNRNVVGDSIWNNTILYSAPDFGGVRADAMYALGEAATNNGTNNVGARVSYLNGPIAAALVAQQVKTGPGVTPAITKQTSYMGGASYDLKAVKLFGEYYRTDAQGADIKTRTYELGASAPVGPGTALVSWSNNRSETRGGAGVIRNLAALGYDYRLSQRTDLYAIYLYDKLRPNGSASSYGMGIRHMF
jgi:predicted porin